MASESDIPETGAVFTFGRSRFAGNEPSRFWVRNDRILQLACGDEHTALVTESGRIFTFGLNEWGQLGLGDTSPRDKPSCIKDLKKEKVILVACGRTHTIVTTESGQLYTFGSNGEGQLGVKDIDQHTTPVQVNSFPPNTKFKMVGAGVDHSVCLTGSGIVYVWGGNSEGQLGTGNNEDKPVPTLLSVGEPVVAIAVGYYHTALLTEKGSVFLFGEVDSGKLGLGDGIKSCQKPQKLSLGGDRIQAVSCGGSHTILLTDQKEVYSSGNGENGQLGHGTAKQQLSVPEKLNLPFKVTAICCGENHTALLSDDGYLYTCGDGRYGKLGQGKDNYSNQFQPSRLLRFDPFIVDKVACGGCHMMVLAHHRFIANGDTPDGVSKLNFEANQTLLENTLDLSGPLSARDRRRQTTDSSFSSLSRTLPSLSGKTLTDHLQNSLLPGVEVRHLPKLKNNLLLGTGPKTNIAEDGDKKEAESINHLNEDEQKSGSNNNVQPLKSLSEIPKPKAAPRTLKPIEAKNGLTVSESGTNDSLVENRLPALDVGTKIEEEKKVDGDHIQNIEEIANHKKSIPQTNGFSPKLSNGNAVNADKNVAEEESTILLSEVKEKKKKKKKKEEKGKVKTKDKEKKKNKEPSEAKVERLESDESEMEELESKERRETEEAKSKKVPKKLERKKSKKEKDNEKKGKEESEEEEEDGEEEEENETEEKDKNSRNSLSRKNSKTKGDEKLKGKKEEENSEKEEEESEGVNKKQKKKKKKTKEDDDEDDDDDDKEKAEGDPTDKMVFAEDLSTEPENQEKNTDKKSHTCIIL